MKEQLMLVRLDTAYCNYLRKFDDKELPLVVLEDINKISFIKLFIKTLKMVTG
jgi:hypothetical protein